MVVRITSSNLWLSHYSDYLIDKGYKTPRGYVFSGKHTWSIYTKKNRSGQRFGRLFQPDIIDMGLDIINSYPV